MPKLFQRIANRLSLRSQSIVFAVLLCALTVGVTAVSSAYLARDEAVRLSGERLEALARAMAQRLDVGMFERFREIRNVAGLSLVRGAWSDEPATAREVLEQLQATLPDYAWIGIADEAGRVRVATGGLLEGVSVAEREWYAAGRGGMTVQDVHGAKLLSEKLGPNSEGEPFRFVDVAAPVHDANGAPIGVLGAHLSWTWATDVRRQLLESSPVDADLELWVLGADGGVLLGPSRQDPPFPEAVLAEAKATGAARLVDRSGPEPVVSTLAATRGLESYPGLGWTVVARQPLSAVTLPADRLFWKILAVGSLVIVAGALWAWRATASVTEPLRRLVESANRVGRDPEERTLVRVGGSRDVLLLSSALRSLLRRLGSAQEAVTAAELAREAAEEQANAEQRRLYAELSEARVLATYDPLTALLNRRGFTQVASDAWQHWRRYRRPLSVLLLDIDHFKTINDRHGHAVGDTVLAEFAALLGRTVRATDSVARIGGEEFVVLLRETDVEGAEILGERLRRAVAEDLATAAGLPGRITTSIGVAAPAATDRDLADAVERADRALYAAKSSGRNRVETETAAEQSRAGAA
jgi:diguanylate cyclase (GGDEF)-like protein